MLKPHDQDMLEAVAEVLRAGLSDVRRDMDARLADMQTKLNFQPDPIKGDRGEDGKSITLEDVQPLIDKAVSEAVAALPPAEPGKDAVPLDPDLIVAAVLEKIPVPQPGKDGDSVSLADVQPMIEQTVKEAVAAIPPPKDGESVTVDQLLPFIETAAANAVATIPPPKDGTSVSLDDVLAGVQPQIDATIAAAVAALPPPDLAPLAEQIAVLREDATQAHARQADFFSQDIERIEQRIAALPPPPDVDAVVQQVLAKVPLPEKGKDADPVDMEEVRRLVLDSARHIIATEVPVPKDGKSITVEDIRGLFEAEQAKWALEFERRAADVLERAIDRMPKPQDGKDALGFDDLEVIFDGERSFEFRFARGDQVKSFPFKVPAMIDRGVYRAGTEYERGDVVTWGGSAWIAQTTPATGKPNECKDWRLAVKRGQNGDKGDRGEDGKNGRDLTKPNGARP